MFISATIFEAGTHFFPRKNADRKPEACSSSIICPGHTARKRTGQIHTQSAGLQGLQCFLISCQVLSQFYLLQTSDQMCKGKTLNSWLIVVLECKHVLFTPVGSLAREYKFSGLPELLRSCISSSQHLQEDLVTSEPPLGFTICHSSLIPQLLHFIISCVMMSRESLLLKVAL